MRATTICLLLLLVLTPFAHAETAAPHNSWVSATRGLNVHSEASRQSDVIAVLWQGARVFVRDDAGPFVRIDGYGVAGYAYVERAYISDQAPSIAPVAAQAAPQIAR